MYEGLDRDLPLSTYRKGEVTLIPLSIYIHDFLHTVSGPMLVFSASTAIEKELLHHKKREPVKVSSPESSQLALRRIANWENGNGETDLHRLTVEDCQTSHTEATAANTVERALSLHTSGVENG